MTGAAKQRTRLLLIDDETQVLDTVGTFLSLQGFEVQTARSGEDGLERLKSGTPDIILLDLAMPGIGGIGFLNRIVGDDGKTPCPVLVFTCRSETREFFANLDVAGFVPKTCDPHELLGKVRQAVAWRKHEQARAAERHSPPTILLGEDDPAIARCIASVLEAAGFAVRVAQSGAEVVKLAAAETPSAVLAAMVLPGLNGDGIARILWQMPATRFIPLVLYDGSGFWRRDDPRLRALPGLKRFVESHDAAALLNAVEKVTVSPA